jgi:trigger factor
MKINIDELSPVKKTLRVEIPPEVVRKEFSHAYADLNRRVRLPGFRPGKAPRAMLQQRYAKQIEEEIVRKLIPDYYQRAVEEAGLRPVELPSIDQVQIQEGAPLIFAATVEVKPPIQLGNYRGLTLPTTTVMVTDVEVEEAIGRVQERFAQLEAHPADHPVATPDFVVLDMTGTVDGQPLPGSEIKGELFEIGKGILRAKLEEAVIGQRAGDRVEARLTLGEEAPPDARGKEALFVIVIQAVKRKILPLVDEDLAKDAGAESLAALRTRLRGELERHRKKEAEATQKQALVKQLVTQHQFTVPQSLVDRELGRIFGRVRQHTTEAGSHEEPTPEELQKFRTAYEPLATERVKGTLLLEAVGADAGVTVSDEEVDAELRTLATEMKLPPEQLKRLLVKQEGSLEPVRRKLLEDKALELVLSHATVKAA